MFSRRSQAFAAFVLAFAIAVLSIGTQFKGLAHLSSEDRQSRNLQSSNVGRTLSPAFANSVRPREADGDDPHPKDGGHFTIYRNDEGEIVCRAATKEEVRQRQFDAERLGLRQINHLERGEAKEPKSEQANSGLTIILRATSQLQQNPTAQQAFVKAAANWEALIRSPITIYIDVDYGTTLFGQPLPAGVLGATMTPRRGHPYQTVRANMIAESAGEGNATKQVIFDALPSTTVPTELGEAGSAEVADATARAIGLLPPTAQSTDPAARIGFNSAVAFDFDPADGIKAGEIDFDAVATHEIGHALGFISGAGLNLPRPAVWDLFRFRTGTTTGSFPTAQRILTIGGSPDPLQFFFAPGNLELGLSTGGPAGSTTNGGDGWQSSHWKHVSGCAGYLGIMSPATPSGCRRTIQNSDLLAISVIGYNLTNNTAPPPVPPPLAAPANDNFVNAQTIHGCSGTVVGTTFGASSEPGEPNHFRSDASSLSPSHSVWYQWQAPATGNVAVTTSGSDFDTILSIYSGSTFGSPGQLNWSDDAPGTLTSALTINATAGTTYRIAVDGWARDQGVIKLNWNACVSPTPTPTASPTPTPTPTPATCPTVLTVNDAGDLPDASVGNGLCATAAGNCTLRAAVQETNALPGCGEININFTVVGTIVLGTALPDINHIVRINGPGSTHLTVQRSSAVGAPTFRILNIAATTVTVTGLTISGGKLDNHGAGIQNIGVLTLTDVRVTGNTTTILGTGSGIFNQGGWLIVIDSAITNNGAEQGNAAGVQNNLAGIAVLLKTTVSNNSGAFDAAGISNNGKTLTLVNCTVSGNSGRGISTVGQSDNTIINSTVSNNNRGGIRNFGTLTLTNTTVAGNSALDDGGGISAANFSTNILKNSIIANNTIGNGSTGPDLQGIFNSQGHNLIGNTSGASFTGTTTNDRTNVNPMLGPLANNGGSTMTHALLAGSPAVDAGSNALALDHNGSQLTTDQRGPGFARTVNNIVDIGAFEFVAPLVLFTDITNHVIAMDSVTFVRDPFSAGGTYNFSSDGRTRVMIFTSNLGVTQPEPDLAVTAGGIPLAVEAVGPLTGVPDMSYVIVRLDPMLVGNVQLTVTFRGVTSNAGVVSIRP